MVEGSVQKRTQGVMYTLEERRAMNISRNKLMLNKLGLTAAPFLCKGTVRVEYKDGRIVSVEEYGAGHPRSASSYSS